MDKTEPDTFPLVIDQTRLADILARRLRRALLLRFYAGSLLSNADRRLLDWVIYSTFCDCQSAGISAEARHLLNEARAGVGLFRHPPAGSGGLQEWSI